MVSRADRTALPRSDVHVSFLTLYSHPRILPLDTESIHGSLAWPPSRVLNRRFWRSASSARSVLDLYRGWPCARRRDLCRSHAARWRRCGNPRFFQRGSHSGAARGGFLGAGECRCARQIAACVGALDAGRQKPCANPSGATAPAETRNRGTGVPALPRRSSDRVRPLSAPPLPDHWLRAAGGFAEIQP